MLTHNSDKRMNWRYDAFYSRTHSLERLVAMGKIYSYIVAEDNGFAPKPDEGHLVYAMEVNRTMLFGHYFDASEFQNKKPSEDNIYGDNIYKETAPAQYEQVDNYFHDKSCISNDLSCSRVLISHNFYYFGKEAPKVPDECTSLIHQVQGHKCFALDDGDAEMFFKWLEDFPKGINGDPRNRNLLYPKVASH